MLGTHYCILSETPSQWVHCTVLSETITIIRSSKRQKNKYLAGRSGK